MKIIFSHLTTCFILFSQCSPKIIDKPVPFDQERIQLSLEYMETRYGIKKEFPSIDPKILVIHWTAIPTFDGSYQAFYESTLPSSRTGIASASSLNVGIHFLVDKKGKIYRLMADSLFARHVIGLNHSALGIENVGTGPLNKAQFRANFKLAKMLMRDYDLEYIIGHHEYKQFVGHPLWKEKDPNYLTEKSDPGDDFMIRLRKKLGLDERYNLKESH